MPGRHPDDDLLADLAADVLPADRARAVEAHVLACDRCAGLLEDAERVRSLLLSGDPGPVPADVWRRIEAALAAEGARDSVGDTAAFQAFAAPPTGPGRVVPLPASADARSAASPSARSSSAQSPSPDSPSPDSPSADSPDDDSAGWTDDADPLDDPVRWGGRPVRSGRSGSGGSRRDARAVGPGRRGSILLAAAAVLAIVAVTGSVKLLGRNSPSEASLSAGSAQSSAPASADAGASGAAAPILRSGREYRAATLGEQAAALLAATKGASGPATARGSTSGAPSPQVAAPGPKVPAVRVPADTTANDITNPARLAACLDALGVARNRLVAVDLATYDGREAAILLLNAAEGSGHEVWAVERTCGTGAEGAMNYTRLRN